MTNNYSNTIYTTILQASVGNIISLLNNFAGDPLFSEKFALAFGTTVSSEQFLQAVTTLPAIEVRSDADLAGALGAFSGDTQKVYLSESLVKGDSSQLEAVLLEEFGHYFDFRFNTTDTPGDEGELFSDVVRGVNLSDSKLRRIQNEDDHAVISIDGQLISVEEAFNKTGYKQLGTPYTDNGYAINTDSSGNVYISGVTFSNSGISGNNNSFLAKYNANGNQVWFKQDQSFANSFFGISLDRNGDIYAAGGGSGFDGGSSLTKFDANGIQVWTKKFGGSGAIGTSTDSSGDIYVGDSSSLAKYDTNGNQIWIRTSSASDARGISTDSGKNVYVTGKTSGSLPGNSNLGGDDAFVTKYDANGTQLWVKQFGTPNSDSAEDITTDSNGNIYITGTIFAGSADYLVGLPYGYSDAFVAKYNANGTQLWFKQFGTPSREDTRGISTDSNGNVYIAGSTSENNNAFVVKFDTNGTQIWMKQFDQTIGASGISTDGSGNSYISGTTGGTLPGNSNLGLTDAFIIGLDTNGDLLTKPSLSDKLTTPIIRFQNTDKPGTYLFAGEQEAASIRQNYKGFKEEGLAFQVAVSKDDPLMQPFYRFRNTQKGREGTYLFAGQQEAISIRTKYKNFVEEGLAFYAYSAGVGGGTTDFARFQNKGLLGTYLFTGSSETTSVMNNSGFTLEGSAFAAAG